MIAIIGGSLAGLAAAARLARAGHETVLIEQQATLGDDLEVATEPGDTVLTLPAAWRDLFRKSGRTLDAELAKAGLELAPAPPRRYHLSDGSTLELPTERGDQAAVLAPHFGQATANAWRDLLDRLDDSWQVLRRIGLESEFSGTLTATDQAVLQPRRSVARLSGEVPALAEVILEVAARLDQDPRRLPAWHAARLSMERSFGRWQLRDADRSPQPADTLARLLVDRVRARGVEVLLGTEVLSIRAWSAEHRLATTNGELAAEAVISTVDPFTHADLTRERPDLTAAKRLQRAPGGGPRWNSWRTLTELPRLVPARPGVLVASAWSPGGPDSWAQLLSGALAAYRVHEELTGEDMRPTNKAYRPPRR